MTTYIVTGFMRTGTSMMMRALEAGGLEAVYDVRRNRLNTAWGDEHYQPNAAGFYELMMEDYTKADFPAAYEGKLVKCLMGGMHVLARRKALARGEYRIVWMRRDYEEIRQSYDAAAGVNLPMTEDAFLARTSHVQSQLAKYPNVRWRECWYREVVADPIRHFTVLRDDLGLPIDVTRAAEIPTEDRVRFKREQLVLGIV